MRKRYTRWQRLVLALRDIRSMVTTGYGAPCGHEAQGDARSWWCTVCGSSGSSG